MRGKKITLVIIILLAFILRFWGLGDYPALNADEASIAYDAYSLIQTGKDQHGNPWPIHFQSFNDYKPGLIVYLILPFVKVFGLSVFWIRSLPALLGTATVFVLFLLSRELFSKNTKIARPSARQDNWKLEILAPAVLAISPWHIHFSRGVWEVNVASFFVTLGIYLFLRGLKQSKFMYFSISVFALSLYAYHAARVITPLLGIGLAIIYRKQVIKSVKHLILYALFTFLLLLPLVVELILTPGLSRAAGVGLFADPGPINRINEQRGQHSDLRGFSTVVLHNKAVNYTLSFLENWAEHYHGEFLFLSGDDIQRNKIPETGQMYLHELIFLVFGMIFLVKSQFIKPKSKMLIAVWLVIAPTASALTFQSPHALRAQNMVIPLTMISALGLIGVFKLLQKQKKYLLVIGNLSLVIMIAWSFTRYIHMYWVHMAKEYPFSSQYGLKELVNFVGGNSEDREKVIITTRYDQPYILYLFYSKYNPEKFQSKHELSPRDKYGFSTVRGFDKFEFKPIDFDYDQPNNPNSLIIGTDEEIPDEANIIRDIYGSNGYKYFQVVAN